MVKKNEKLVWGDFYNEQSIKDNERLLKYEESYNFWDEQNEYDWNNMYSIRDENERYMQYLNSTKKTN